MPRRGAAVEKVQAHEPRAGRGQDKGGAAKAEASKEGIAQALSFFSQHHGGAAAIAARAPEGPRATNKRGAARGRRVPADDAVWLGSIYVKDEGGYAVVLRALRHYARRLASIGASPEVAGAGGAFAQIISHEASRTGPLVVGLAKRLPALLAEDGGAARLEPDMPLIKRALESYKVDLAKAADPSADAYYRNLVARAPERPGEGEAARVEEALRRIGRYDK